MASGIYVYSGKKNPTLRIMVHVACTNKTLTIACMLESWNQCSQTKMIKNLQQQDEPKGLLLQVEW